MTIKNFLRKIFSHEQEKPELIEISLEKLPAHLDLELEKINKKAEEIKKTIKQNISISLSDIESQIEILRKIDVDNKKEDQRIKLIVKENLKSYISYLEKLTDDLGNIQETGLKEFLQKIHNTIHNFEASSRNSFEKATILIGELGKTREMIRRFTIQLDSSVSENKHIFAKEELIESIKKLFLEASRLKNAEKEASSLMQEIGKEEKEIEKQINEKREEIEKLKNSLEYKKELDERQVREQETSKFSQEISKIKEDLDLKFLAKKFHSDTKKSRIIESYLENFLGALEQDEDFQLERLIKEANQKEINLHEIKEKHKELSKPLFLLIQEKINSLEKEIKDINSKLITIKEEQKKQENRIKKFQEKCLEIEHEIKEKAKNLNITVS